MAMYFFGSRMTAPDNASKDSFKEAGQKGGRARARKLSASQRSDIARKAVTARWKRARVADDEDIVEIIPPDGDIFEGPAEGLPVAKYKGELNLMDLAVPCY